MFRQYSSSISLMFFLLIFLGLESCILPRSPVSEEQLVGTWEPTWQSLRFMKSENICCFDRKIELTLNEDKTFSLKNIPDCWRYMNEHCGDTVSYDGTWIFSNNTLRLNGSPVGVDKVFITKLMFCIGDTPTDTDKFIYLTKR